ncbi:MAG: DUF4872 domain-containing protein [Anaerolineae bacterium]|nr:DUF4872 domain-containing protein [Anaerolineae bacterium]
MTSLGGIFPNTASLRNVLANQGNLLSEALLLGVGGGLGAGYILWEFKVNESVIRILVQGFNNRWNYAAERMTILCQRLGITPVVHETAGVKAAAAHLQAALDAGKTPIAWVDQAHLPYHGLPERLQGHRGWIVGVHGRAADGVLVDDLGEVLYTVPDDRFAAGRARIGSDKNRLLIADAPPSMDLPAAVRAGIEDHIDHLSRDSDSFSLPVYAKWAKMLTDTKNKKGWPVVFQTRVGLYAALASTYEGIVLDGSDGAGLRALYADFLDEAATILGQPALKDAAQSYRHAAACWRAFADAALPEALFGETRRLMHQRESARRQNRLSDLAANRDRLESLAQAANRAFPLDDAATMQHFAAMQAALQSVHAAEVAALAALKQTFPA